MKFFLSGILFLILFAVEHSLADFSVGGIAPPLGIAFLLLWLSRLSLPITFSVAGVGGLLYDAVGVLPFGSHTLVFLLIACLVALLQAVFSSTSTPFVQSAILCIGLATYFIFIFPAALLLGGVEGIHVSWNLASLSRLSLGIVFWIFVLGAGSFILLSTRRR